MGKTPFHSGPWHAARRIIALATVFALVVGPLVVVLTHGPAAHATAASASAEMAAGIAVHGHTHEEAGHDYQGGPFGGHNPADHDHQFHALVCQATSAPRPLPDKAQCALSAVFRHLTQEGPRRPPRSL